MIIEFNREEEEQLCTQQGIARVRYGVANEKKLHRIIAIISNAESLRDVRAVCPKAHWLEGDRHWQISIPLADGNRLILEPLAYTTREWHKIEAVRFIEITDYHK